MNPISLLTADPPWSFGDKLPGATRGAANNYRVLDQAGIESFLTTHTPPLPLADDCLLILWRVGSQVEEAYRVVRAWGFVPKSEIVWVKTPKGSTTVLWDDCDYTPMKLHMGMGRYVRNGHEIAIVAARGKFKVADRGVRSVLFAPVGEHSAKPDTFYQMIEKLAGPDAVRVELFGRKGRAGWTVFGDELPDGMEGQRLQVDPATLTLTHEMTVTHCAGTQFLIECDGWRIAADALAREAALVDIPVATVAAPAASILEYTRTATVVAAAVSTHGWAYASGAWLAEARLDPNFAIRNFIDTIPLAAARPEVAPDPRRPETFSAKRGRGRPPGSRSKKEKTAVLDDAPEDTRTSSLFREAETAPASTELTRENWVQLAYADGILRDTDSHLDPQEAYERLLRVAPPGWCRARKPGGEYAGAMENLSTLANDLTRGGFPIDLLALARIPPDERRKLRIWADNGGDKPWLLTPGCAACTRDVPLTDENGHIHTNAGPYCVPSPEPAEYVVMRSTVRMGPPVLPEGVTGWAVCEGWWRHEQKVPSRALFQEATARMGQQIAYDMDRSMVERPISRRGKDGREIIPCTS